ncbi:MAG: proton-conducting transporter transmembrane domain-containing protein [Ehrlichia sp.]
MNVGDLFSIIQDRSLGTNKVLQVGVLFIIVGLFVKIALFPFHRWLIQAYSSVPTFIAVFFSGISTKVMLYLLIKVVYEIFKVELLLSFLPFNIVFMCFASLSIVFASFFAVLSSNMKKIFAYSSVAHLGYVIFALGLNTYYGLVAAIIYIIHHSLVKSALFMVMGSVSYNCGSLDIKSCVNMWKSMPKIALPFVILCISILGMPITSGFISKWYIFDATIKSDFFTRCRYFVGWIRCICSVCMESS